MDFIFGKTSYIQKRADKEEDLNDSMKQKLDLIFSKTQIRKINSAKMIPSTHNQINETLFMTLDND